MTRKALTVACLTAALTFGATGVAHSAPLGQAEPTITVSAQNEQVDSGDNGDEVGSNTGLWGLAGLAGLVGLLGLRRRADGPRA